MDAIRNMPTYMKAFVALAVLTAVEVWAATLNASPQVIVITLIALALSKAAIVAFYYMHLKYERPLLSYIALSPFGLSLILILFLLADSTLNPR